MRKSFIVKIAPEYMEIKNIPSDIGLVLRGPYEHVIKLTPQYSTCEAMYDVLVSGKIYKLVPCAYCTKV
tara:strand:- start:10986 stop:11192 length:207 start_codon:yes stop_codon:yes gene_type:complete